MKKKILIVGGAGYLGGFMVDLFCLDSKYEVTVYDILLYESRYLKKVNFIFGDVLNYKKIGKIINDYDVVVWLAAIVGDGACAVNPEHTNQVNFESVKWLVDNYKKKIIFTSTCSVYGVNHELISEEAKPNPLSIYASTKLKAEEYIIKNAKNYTIFRLGTLYGLSDEHSRIRLDLVVNTLTLKAVQGEKLSVFGGEQWRPLLHVRDVAHATKFVIEKNISSLFNLSECNIIIADLAKIIAKHIPNTQIKCSNMKFEDLRNYRVTNKKIMKTGWKPKENLDDGINEMIKVFSENRIKNFQDPIYSNAIFLQQLNKKKDY